MNYSDTLRELAIAFRQALEDHLAANDMSINTDFFGDPTSKFPKRCCKGSALIFGQFLIESLGMQGVEFVNGSFDGYGSHGWTEVNNHAVDLTADQFGDQFSKVIVTLTKESAFHTGIKLQQRFPSCIPPDGTFRDVLIAVTDKLSNQFNFHDLRGVLIPPDNLKEQLFKKYSTNLELVSKIFFPDAADELAGKYICPLCFTVFPIEALDISAANHLTEEHIPPQSVGWKRKVLTCKMCNNTQGGQFDSQVLLLLKKHAFNERVPGTTIQAKFKVGSNVANGVAKIKPDGSTSIAIIKERTNPKDYQQIKDRLEKNIQDDISIVSTTGNMKRALISMIRAAYLWGFSEYGYAFIVNPNFEPLIDQIKNPKKNIFFEKQVLIGEFQKAWEGINVVIEPEEMTSYAFMMNLNAYGVTDKICVLLPGGDENGLKRLESLRDLISNERPNISFRDASDLAALNDPDHCFDIFAIWHGEDK